MGVTPVFSGRVLPGGLLVLDRRADYARHLRSLRGRFVEVIVRKQRTQRSLDQNAFLHAVVFPMLGDHFGYTIPEVKLVLMGECFGWKSLGAHEIPIQPSTSAMSVEDCTRFIEWVIPWAMVNHNVSIPLPNEVAA